MDFHFGVDGVGLSVLRCTSKVARNGRWVFFEVTT
jgi:hypothetical protein